MVEINLIKNLKALISVRVSLETIPSNGKFEFDNDLKSKYSNSSGNNSDNNN